MHPVRSAGARYPMISLQAQIRTLGLALIAATSLWVAGACLAPEEGSGEALVFAAASLADVLGDIQKEFEDATATRLSFSYGGSQSLAQQIASGAPADMLISAGRGPVNFLVERDKLASEPVGLVTNRLVVVLRQGLDLPLSSVAELATSDGIRRIALAEPDLAPAGEYARESLTTLGIWADIQHRLVTGTDVRSTLAYVESGNADAALVYATDARAARNVDVLDIVPPDSYSPIVFPVALIDGSPNSRGAVEFLDFLRGATAQSIFRGYGFQPLQ